MYVSLLCLVVSYSYLPSFWFKKYYVYLVFMAQVKHVYLLEQTVLIGCCMFWMARASQVKHVACFVLYGGTPVNICGAACVNFPQTFRQQISAMRPQMVTLARIVYKVKLA